MSDLGLSRRRSRERSLEILYESAIKARSADVVLSELNTRPDGYAVELVTSAAQHQDQANALISEFSADWALERIALVDRLIMTLAIGEMLMDNPPPVAVILDEAVELAKVFSTDGSPSFVNGVLSSVSQRLFN
ncbi:MAG TPA: transcription antitermination factor NusB [Acidimicrobiales bacterium]|nr:transcription antitermination factor NusB [Acidimicrobiales bacterium]